MSNNPIKSDGVAVICNNVSCCLRQLNKLYVSECGIDFNGFIHVVQTYAHGVHRLHTLVLDNNALDSNKRFDTLREMFKNFNVCNLSLRNCDLSALSVSYFADFLKANDIVRSVNLSSNNITDTAFNAYAALPQCLSVMEKFDVSCNLITNASAIPFITALRDNTTLREVNLSNNQLRNETACALLKTLERNVTLMRVNLGMNFVKGEVVDKVNALLKRNRKVRKGRYVPQLKATIKTSRVDQGVYAVFQGQIALSQKQRVKLMSAVKEDEERYESMKMELRRELDVVLARVNEVEREIARVNDDCGVREEVKRLEMENGSLKMIREKNKIMEMNVKGKLKELQQKKEMLLNNNSGNSVIRVNNMINNDHKSKTMINGGTKLHVVNLSKSKKKKKSVKTVKTVKSVKPSKHNNVLPLTNNNNIHNLHKVEYDTTLKRTKQHEQHIMQQRSRMEWNSTSISNYGETDLTSPKHSLFNTVTVVSNN